MGRLFFNILWQSLSNLNRCTKKSGGIFIILGLINRGSEDAQEIDVAQVNRQPASTLLSPININFYDSVRLNKQQTNGFNFMHFRQEEVLRSFIDIKSNAIGCDRMHPKFIRLMLPYTLIYFTQY